MTVRDRLLALIESWDLPFEGPVLEDTPLITSGMLDSQALFNLMLWIEEQIGSTVDPTAVDVAEAWNTVADVVTFIEQRRRAAGANVDAKRDNA